jgi:hypothetical protein
MAPREKREEKIARLAFEHKMAKQEAAAATKRAEEIEKELLPLVPMHETLDDLRYDNYGIQITHVQVESKYLDEGRLARQLPLKIWNKVTRRRLDSDLLAKAIEDGTVSSALVDECTETRLNKPYPRITLKLLLPGRSE